MSTPFDLERLHGSAESWKEYLVGLPGAQLFRLRDELQALIKHPSGASFKVQAGIRHMQVVDEFNRRWMEVWQPNADLSNDMTRIYATWKE